MKKNHKWWIVSGVLVGGLVLAAASVGPVMSNVEQPRYTVVESDRDIEIRAYEPLIVAETEVTGTREMAIREGFRAIADYIFGNNVASQEIAMTAPVTQQASEPIAMTAPVMQQGDGLTWMIRFVMPSRYTMQSLPKPKNAAVRVNKYQENTSQQIVFPNSRTTEFERTQDKTKELYFRTFASDIRFL